jgi:hypothetical protein
MSTSAEAVVDTANGVILVRDTGIDTRADQRAAAEAGRIPGSRGRGHMIAAAGTVLQIRCAHQLAHPRIRLEAHPNEGPYRLTVLSGRLASTPATPSPVNCRCLPVPTASWSNTTAETRYRPPPAKWKHEPSTPTPP